MLIGLTGYAQSGKDTVAEILVSEGFTRVAFADIMREALLVLNPYAGTYRLREYVSVNGWDVAKVALPEIRNLMQRFGTEVGRGIFGEDFWIKQLLNRYDLTSKNYVVSDIRFPNEAGMIKDHNGLVWRITRPNVGPVNAHVSDKDMGNIKVDYTLNNDSDLESLVVLTKALLKANS